MEKVTACAATRSSKWLIPSFGTSKASCITPRGNARFAGAQSIAEEGMVARQNYLKVKLFLKYLEEVQQVSKASLDRYSFYLRHLLLWANDRSLGESLIIRPTLQAYAASITGKNGQNTLAFESQKKIIETSKRFFIWAKATYPREFSKITLTWIETLRPKDTPNWRRPGVRE